MFDTFLNFLVRQRWRIAQTYLTILPIVGILNTSLYFLIFLGVTGVSLDRLELFLGFLFLMMSFTFIGYILDKIGYFKKDISKTFSSAQLEAYKLQADWNALKIAYYSKFTKEELAILIATHTIANE